MKKISAGIVTIAVIGLLAGSALAWDHYGRGYGHYGMGYGMHHDYAYGDDAGVSREARNQFLTETADLRKDLASKRIELDAVMSAENPDQETAGKLSKEVFELREQIHAKAEAAGVAGPLAGRGYGYGHYGRGMRAGGGYCRR